MADIQTELEVWTAEEASAKQAHDDLVAQLQAATERLKRATERRKHFQAKVNAAANG